MSARSYSNTSPPRSTASSLGSVTSGTSNTVTLSDASNLPATPFTASLERTSTNEELVLVTSISGLTATITRGYDGSNSPAHVSGVDFEHAVGALDYREANAHVNASTGVHGLAGAVVGTTDTQTLTAKSLVGATGLTSSATPALTLRAYAADPSIPVLQATSEDGSVTTLLIGSSGVITGTSIVLQPIDDRVVQLLKPKSGNTSDISRWASAAGTVLGKVDVAGQLLFSGNVSMGSLTPISGSRLSLQTGAAGTVGATVRGAAAQSADLVAYQDSGANPLGGRGPDGASYAPGFGHTSKAGPLLTPSAAGFTIAALEAADQPLALKRFTGQTANLLALVDEAGATVGRLTADAELSLTARLAGSVPVQVQAATGQTGQLAIYRDSSATEVAGVTADGRPYADAFKMGITLAANNTPATAPTPSSDATNYPFGTSIRDVTTGGGWPDTGTLETHRYNRPFQLLLGTTRLLYRTSSSNVWQPWRGGNVGWGHLGYAEKVTDDVLASSGVRDVGPSVSFTIFETRLVLAIVVAQLDGVAGATYKYSITDSSNVVQRTSGVVTSVDDGQQVTIMHRKALAAGSYTWKIRQESVSGSNGKTLASSTDPTYLQVLDLGLAT